MLAPKIKILIIKGFDINITKLKNNPLVDKVDRIETEDYIFEKNNAHLLDIIALIEKNKALDLKN
jgi:hypothetical protein